MKNFFTLKKDHKGFTMVEIIVVIAIIGIIAALFLVALSRARIKMRDAEREGNIRQISLAMEMAYDDDDYFPTAENYPESISSSQATYLGTTPSDPQGGDYYWMDNTINNQTYCVSADLESGDHFKCTQDGCAEELEGC